jgi:hypothetical protein
MRNSSLARTAGIIGMVGGALWIISVVMQDGFGVGSSSGALAVVAEISALLALASMNIGFLGLIWGGAFRGRLGTFAVALHVLAHTLIVVGGVAGLLLGDAAGPLFLVFPIGGALQGPSQLLIAVAVLATARWDGWQCWIPLFYSIYAVLAVGLPFVFGVTPDGPGMSIEIGQGVWWFLVGLAVYTAQARAAAPHPSVVGQV